MEEDFCLKCIRIFFDPTHVEGSTVHNQNKNNSSESETNIEWSKSRWPTFMSLVVFSKLESLEIPVRRALVVRPLLQQWMQSVTRNNDKLEVNYICVYCMCECIMI